MSQTLKLSDEVYEALDKAAREDGLTPAEWLRIQLRIADESIRKRPLAELTVELTGVIDSTDTQSTHRTAFSSALAEKFRKQGLRIP